MKKQMISSWIFVAACFALDSRSLSLDQDADNDSVNWTWRFLRNEVISSHLRFDRILDEAKKEDELYIYLRWEITPMHLAHLLPLALADWLKRTFNASIMVHFARNPALRKDAMEQQMKDTLEDINAFGLFQRGRSWISHDIDDLCPEMARIALKAKLKTNHSIEDILLTAPMFAHPDPYNRSKLMPDSGFAPNRLVLWTHHDNNLVKVTSDIAKVVKGDEPAFLFAPLDMPSLMSPKAIYLEDKSEEVQEKVEDLIHRGDAAQIRQILALTLQDHRLLNEILTAYSAKKLPMEKLTRIVAKVVNDIVSIHQKSKANRSVPWEKIDAEWDLTDGGPILVNLSPKT